VPAGLGPQATVVDRRVAERIVLQFFAVRAELKNRIEEADLDKIAATLTAALWASDEGAKANGLATGKPTYMTRPGG
jgi:hypothetical protein